MSRGIPPEEPVKTGKSIVIMGNGPSLRQTIDKDAIWLCSNDLMAVNFAANTPDFFNLRPGYYILADGHFFLRQRHGSERRGIMEESCFSLMGHDPARTPQIQAFCKSANPDKPQYKTEDIQPYTCGGFQTSYSYVVQCGIRNASPKKCYDPCDYDGDKGRIPRHISLRSRPHMDTDSQC